MTKIKKILSVLIVGVMVLSLGACDPVEPQPSMSVRASVVEIEKYGHAVLSVTAADLMAAGYGLGDMVCVRFGERAYTMPLFDGYYSNPGSLLLRASHAQARVAVCINYGDFCAVNGISVGDTAEITLSEKAGMLAIQQLYALQYSNKREDYADDASFANFRAVTAGRIGYGKLYRSASPVNNEKGRADYADTLIESVGVATILNLADSDEDIAEYLSQADFTSDYYRALYQGGKVVAIDLTGNFYSDDFAACVARGLTFLARNDPPYAIHCTEGKDRAGFTAMLLEALMGATLDEIVGDYMLSFYNYYGITKDNDPQRYQAVLDTNLLAMLCHVTAAESAGALGQMDLEAAVTEYLLDAGMLQADIVTLKEKLG